MIEQQGLVKGVTSATAETVDLENLYRPEGALSSFGFRRADGYCQLKIRQGHGSGEVNGAQLACQTASRTFDLKVGWSHWSCVCVFLAVAFFVRICHVERCISPG